MSASNSQILDQTEPLRGVKHMKPPIKPPVKPKPLVPPRPKEIPGSSTENKSPLLSPTCGPCSPTLDIPSAIKISQLTGPQPYGTRRTSLKRWSSSVGEDVNPENNAFSPVENKSIDLPAKTTAKSLSAPLKPLQTGPVWKGKSPFMLTTRGWGEQRINQSKESDAVSLKSSSSLLSKDTDAQKKETTALKEDSNSHSRITPEEKVITHVLDSITKSEKTPSVVSEDVTTVSSELGSSNRPALVKEFQKELPAPLQSDLYFENSKKASQYDHKENITSIGSEIKEKAPSATRESLHVQKSQIEDENEKMAIVYDNQIPDVKSGLGHVLACEDDIIVDQGQLENRGENHQPEAYVEHGDLQQIADVIPKHAEHTNTASEQPSHHEKQEPKDISVTSALSPPKPKERKKPCVQFIVPKADDPAEEPRSLDSTLSESERRETKEYKQKEDGNADMRRWHGEDGIEKIPVSYGQQKTDEKGNQEKSAEINEPPGYVRTQTTNYTVTIDDNISKDAIDDTSHRSDRHNTIQENIDICQPDIHESSLHKKETKIAYEEDESSISYTTKLDENVERGNQPNNVVEDYRSFHKRQPEGDPAVKNVDYMPHFAHTPPDSSPRPEHENYEYPSHDSGTAYIHHYKSTMDHSECDDIKEPSHMSIESQSEDKFTSREINTHSVEFHPPSALTQSQEEMTQLKKHESNSSKSKLGYLQDLASSKSEVQSSNFGDPTYKVIQSTVKSNISDHKEGLQYYNIYSQNLQDREEIKHRVDESEDHDYSHSHVEQPLHEHAQSEKPVHRYEPSEGLVSTFTESNEMVHTYAPFEEQVHTYIASEEPVHTYVQSEENEHSCETSEEPVQKYAQFEEPMQDYSQSEEESQRYAVIKKPKYEYDHSEKLEQMYEQPEKQFSHNAESVELTHSHEPSKTQTLTYEQHMKPIYTYDDLKESYPQDTQIRETEMAYEQVYQHAEEKHVQPEDSPENIIPHIKTESHYQQTQAEEPVSKNSLSSEMPLELPNYLQKHSEEPNYQFKHSEESEWQEHSEEPNCQYKQSEKSYYQEEHSEEPNYQYKQSEKSYYQKEHSEEPNYQYKQSEKSYYQKEHLEEPNYQYKQSEKSYYQEEHSEEPNYQYKQSEKSYYQEEHSEEPNYQYKQSEKSYYQKEHLEEPNYQYKQSEKSYYQEEHSEEPNYQYKQSEKSYYQEEHSEEPNYQYKQSEESYYKDEHSKEPNYQQEHADEPNYHEEHSNEQKYQETRSEELNAQEILPNKNIDSKDSHLISYYSEQSDEKDGQEEKSKMFGENNHGLTESIEEKYMDLHAAENDSRHITSAEQDKPKRTLEKYLEQPDSGSTPEEYHHKDDSTSETYNNNNKELLSKEQKLEYTQKEEPKTLDTHTVESEPQDHTDSRETNKHSQFLESHREEIQDTCAEDDLDKHTLNEKNLNGLSELEESEHIEDRSGGHKLSHETHEESPVDTASEAEETPEENFDFLEGTNVLDTSLMRGRASLGKKRCHRTPAAGTCTAPEETDPEYWMFRDSTEPRCAPGKDSDDEAKEETSTDCTPENSPTSVKSPTKKGGIFSAIISPSILKGRLKSRNKAPEGEASKTESKESQEPTSPTSPGKDKSESSSHSLSWLQALKKKKKKHPK
ncbi:182 kDa tankyrase-1-binding protein [Phyllobates terribilis]|uniref:182 kDa tankyrase-1-binding protein n=1 Tax=Phyllobates terribilis TaxID=111132 RepID=UPI003CCA8587